MQGYDGKDLLKLFSRTRCYSLILFFTDNTQLNNTKFKITIFNLIVMLVNVLCGKFDLAGKCIVIILSVRIIVR